MPFVALPVAHATSMLWDDVGRAQFTRACRDAAERLQEATAQLADAERNAATARAEMVRRDRATADAARVHSRQLAEAQSRADALAEENTSLLLDLNARPGQRDVASLRRQVEVLEQRLRKAEASPTRASSGNAFGNAASGKSTSGAAAHAENTALSENSAQEANQQRGSTRERISRDKKVAAMQLTSVQHLSKTVLTDIVQDACISLDVRGDATALPAAIAKLQRVAAAVPGMEGFVEDICDNVFKHGASLLPHGLLQRDPSTVVHVRSGS